MIVKLIVASIACYGFNYAWLVIVLVEYKVRPTFLLVTTCRGVIEKLYNVGPNVVVERDKYLITDKNQVVANLVISEFYAYVIPVYKILRDPPLTLTLYFNNAL